VVVGGPEQPLYVPSPLVSRDDDRGGPSCGKTDRSRGRCLLGGDGRSEGGGDGPVEDLRGLSGASLRRTAEPGAGRSRPPRLYGVVDLGLYDGLGGYYGGFGRQAFVAVGH